MRDLAIAAAWLGAALALFLLSPWLKEASRELGLNWWHAILGAVVWGIYQLSKDLDRMRAEMQALRRAVESIRRDDA